MLDPEGHVTNWNAGAERIKGYLADEIVGQHFSRFYTEEDRAAGLPQHALETAAREGRFEREGWRVRKDGTPFWANVVIDAIRDEQGKLIGFAKVTRDITEKREAQRALEAGAGGSVPVAEDGSGRPADRRRRARLQQSAHGGPRQLLKLLRKRLPDDPRLTGLLENAIQGAQRGASLTSACSPSPAGTELKPEPLDLPALVHGMADLLQRSLGPSVHIETRFPLSLPPARADANQLELALLNLAVNARDAMPEGGSIVISRAGRSRQRAEGPPFSRPLCLPLA